MGRTEMEQVARTWFPSVRAAILRQCGSNEDFLWITPPLIYAIFERETLVTTSSLYRIYKTEDEDARKIGKKAGDRAKGLVFGRGDHGHGCGPGQIDDRAHPRMIESGEWKQIDKHLDYIIRFVLMEYYLRIERWVDKGTLQLDADGIIKAAISAYNCGPGNAKKGVLRRNDSDYYTTGRNYARDVLVKTEKWEKVVMSSLVPDPLPNEDEPIPAIIEPEEPEPKEEGTNMDWQEWLDAFKINEDLLKDFEEALEDFKDRAMSFFLGATTAKVAGDADLGREQAAKMADNPDDAEACKDWFDIGYQWGPILFDQLLKLVLKK